MLYECVNCEFYVADDEKFCPDCGLNAPTAPLKFKSQDDFDRPLILKTAVITAIVIVAGIGVFRVFEGSADFSDWSVIIVLVLPISLLLSFLIAPFIARRSASSEQRRRFGAAEMPTNFQFVQDTISLRNIELETKLYAFGISEKRGSSRRADRGKSRVPVEKIEITNLIARYDLLNRRIEFVRLQNELRAIIGQQKDVTNKADRAEWIGEVLSELETMNSNLTDDAADQISEKIRDEKRHFLAEIAETERFCQALLKNRIEIEPFQADAEQFFVEDFTSRIKSSDGRKIVADLVESLAAAERRFSQLKVNRQ